ncbi:hypothetical protein D3C75_978160 [compost metagenome]
MADDQRFDIGAHFPVTGQHDFEHHRLGGQQPRSFKEQQLALLFTQTPDANQARHTGGHDCGHFVKHALQATMHHLDLGPVLMRHPAKQLAAPVGADRRDERSAPDFFAQIQKLRFVELFRAMHGKTVSGPTEYVGQHHHLG